MRIKILKNDNLGDVILSLPFIHCMENFFPTVTTEVFVKHPAFTQLRDIFKLKSDFAVFPSRKNLSDLKDTFFKTDSVLIDLVGNRFNSLLCYLSLCTSFGVNRYRLESFYKHKTVSGNGYHESVIFLKLIPQLLAFFNNSGLNSARKQLTELLENITKFHPADVTKYKYLYRPFLITSEKHPDEIGGNYFVYHAGGHASKCFNMKDQKKLISLLSKLDYKAVITGLENEAYAGRIIENEFNRNFTKTVNMVGKTVSLKELANIFANAVFYFGPDSGTAHLSAALGTRTIIYFGPTNAERFSPCGKDVLIFNSESTCSSCWEPQTKFNCSNIQCMDLKYFNGLIRYFENFSEDS